MLYPQQNDCRNLLDLSGFWDFKLDQQEVGEKEGWFSGLSASRQIAVPASWNEQFQDTRDYMGIVWYLRRFYAPAGWQGQSVFLRVGSANYAAKVWLNGQLVGGHEGGHLPFDLEITDTLAWDRPNTVAIQVENKLTPTRVPPGNVREGGLGGFMAGYPSTSFDFFPYGGLHRPVILWAAPRTRIEDVTVTTEIAGEQGIVKVAVHARGAQVGQARLSGEGVDLKARLIFADGAAGATAAATLSVPKARLWGPDDPYLYQLEVTLGDAGQTLDRYTLEIGIRTIGVQGDKLLLNGKPILLKGFGKHEDFPVHGRGLNMPLIVKDNSLFQWLGANSYRTSHYPYSEEAMLHADRAGILIIDETPAVGMSFGDGPENIRIRLEGCKKAQQELIARDKNHPSVIMWSVSNEPMPGNMMAALMGGRGPVDHSAGIAFFTELFAWTRALDPTRPATLTAVMGGPVEWMQLCDVACINRYWGWYTHTGQLDEGTAALAQELDALHASLGKPMIVTEFGAEAFAGWHSDPPEAWTEEYQAEMLRCYLDVAAARPFMVGMHIWNFADFKTGQSTFRPRAMNQKGVFTRDRQPKMAAHLLRERWNKPEEKTRMETPKTEPTATPSQTGSILGAFQMLASRLDGKQPGLTRTIKFDFGDQVYCLVFADGRCEAVEGDGEAVATVRLKTQDAMAFLTGKLNPMTALMTGVVKVEGDMMALLVLQKAM